MKIWLSRQSDISLHEQITTQLVLGIVSGDLSTGERLPSVRQFARRHRIHANTVSAAYKQLAEGGWLEARRGSGVYVRERPAGGSLQVLDRLIDTWFAQASRLGYDAQEVRTRISRRAPQPLDPLYVFDPDAELAEILAAEIRERAGIPAQAMREGELVHAHATVAALMSRSNEVQPFLGPATAFLPLRLRSVPETLAGYRQSNERDLITVISRSTSILERARIYLAATGVDPAAILLRDATEPDFLNGAAQSTLIVADVLTARLVPRECRVVVFTLIADSSIAGIRACGNRESVT